MNTGRITVFGGDQKRPNIHIDDMTDLYVRSLEWPDEQIDGQDLQRRLREPHRVPRSPTWWRRSWAATKVDIVTTPTDDHRSYHISSEKIKRELGFEPSHSVEEAVRDLSAAYGRGAIPDAMTDKRYYNIKTMLEVKL